MSSKQYHNQEHNDEAYQSQVIQSYTCIAEKQTQTLLQRKMLEFQDICLVSQHFLLIALLHDIKVNTCTINYNIVFTYQILESGAGSVLSNCFCKAFP